MLLLILLAASGLTAARVISSTSSRPTIGLNITKIDWKHESSKRALSGPQMGVDFPDPSLIWGDGSWKAYGTSSNGKNVPIATSSDAFTWSLSGVDAMPVVAPWMGSDHSIWAPDVQKNDAGTYVMYFTGLQNGGNHCVGIATSSAAMGPFTPQAQPLICNDASGVIDPSGYDDGVDRWILWKVDGNSQGGATTCHAGGPTSSTYLSTPIMIQKMARDAMTLLDAPSTILDNQGAANDGVVEAPSLYHAPDGSYVLFYSAHCYSSDDYDIEYAWSDTIDGSYGDRGILARTSDNIGIYGPGGFDLDPNGANGVFHGRTIPNSGGSARELYSATITFNGESVSH